MSLTTSHTLGSYRMGSFLPNSFLFIDFQHCFLGVFCSFYKITSILICHIVGFISLAISILGGWDVCHLKGGIHSSVGSAKSFLYDIRKLRYAQNKMEYQILKIFNIRHSSVIKSAVCFISLATNMLEGFITFFSKGGIYSSVWSTKKFLYDIRGPRCKQNNMVYQISRI